MFSRYATCLLVLLVAVAGCSGDAVPPDSRPAPSTSPTTETTVAATTTTTSFSVQDAPVNLASAVEVFYQFATGAVDQVPNAVPGIIDQLRIAPAQTPSSGVASVGAFKGSPVAVVEMGDDVFLAVRGENGWRIVGGHWPSLSVPAYYGPGPRLVAVVGSDARPGEDVDRTRADSIHFIGLDGEGGGAVVGLPRDSYVPVPGFGSRKITGSLALGGPDTMLEAFRDLTALPLEGYLLTGFEGFQQMVDSVLGTVEVTVPFPIDDRWAKASLDAGLQMLNGFDALAFARARKTVPGGDFTRSSHQGEILLGAAKTVKALGYRAIPGLMEGSEEWLITDLDAEQLLTLSALIISANLDDIPNVVAPGTVGTAGGASVVFLTDEAEGIWVDLADGRLEP
jgi:LCP family protein required for cell wall assembly